jgi:hypothetical protein
VVLPICIGFEQSDAENFSVFEGAHNIVDVKVTSNNNAT